jgi:hypothetical protein
MSIRSIQSAPVQSKYNGKWACVFQTFLSHNGEEHLSGELETAAVWFDAVAARAAGERALEVLEQTGKYPNLCEIW